MASAGENGSAKAVRWTTTANFGGGEKASGGRFIDLRLCAVA
jgi:hypothetical protein